jgi:heme-degrading monooxygenase HmoA
MFWDAWPTLTPGRIARSIVLAGMISVIYRWRIDPELREDFANWWHEGTLRIRSSRKGAKGSTLLQAKDDDAHIVAIARWASEPDLDAFWQDPGESPFAGAVLESVGILEERDHLTIEES